MRYLLAPFDHDTVAAMPLRSGRADCLPPGRLAMLTTFAVTCLLQSHSVPADSVISTGIQDKRLASFDRLMEDVVSRYHVPGASLAVGRRGKLVYARGFGLCDVNGHTPVEPSSLFRIASLSKMLTATAILQLAEQHKLKLSDPVVSILSQKPFNGQMVDDRWKKVTIDQLLHHTGGWDRDASFDPMFRPVRIASAVGGNPPADQNMIIGYMLARKLDFDPGTQYAYSNFGYCLLGRVIEQITGERYETYVQQHVLAPLEISDMRLGHTLEPGRASVEVTYYASGNGKSVFKTNLGQQVPLPYGAWNLEAMDSHGGWIASASDLVRFGESFDEDQKHVLTNQSIKLAFARPDDKPSPVYYGCGWEVRPVGKDGRMNTWHTGLLDGTSALLVRRYDGLTWAVLFNTDRPPGDKTPLSDLIDPLLHKAADEVKQWP